MSARMTAFVLLVAAAVAGGLVGCWSRGGGGGGGGGGAADRAPAQGSAEEGAGVVVLGPERVAVVRRVNLEAGPRIAGNLEAAKRAVLRAEIGGSVLAVKAEIGDKVKAGQLLARIESGPQVSAAASARSAVASAEEDVRLAERQAERTQRLVRAGALSQRDLETAQSAVASAHARLSASRSQLSAAAEQLSGATVRAPFAGVVAERAVGRGDIVAPGSSLFTIIDPSSMRLTGTVPSDALSDVHVGSRVLFTVRGFPKDEREGTVSRVAPAVDPRTRQVAILVDIQNADRHLLAGLFAEGRVVAAARAALVVPTAAVVTDGAPHVLRIAGARVAPRLASTSSEPTGASGSSSGAGGADGADGGVEALGAAGVVESVAVTTGVVDQDHERVEISSGLAAGDVVVVGAESAVAPGVRVEVRAPPVPPPSSTTPRAP